MKCDHECPFCDGMGEDEDELSAHLRLRCPAVKQWRVEELGLPPEGYDHERRVMSSEERMKSRKV